MFTISVNRPGSSRVRAMAFPNFQIRKHRSQIWQYAAGIASTVNKPLLGFLSGL